MCEHIDFTMTIVDIITVGPPLCSWHLGLTEMHVPIHWWNLREHAEAQHYVSENSIPPEKTPVFTAFVPCNLFRWYLNFLAKIICKIFCLS